MKKNIQQNIGFKTYSFYLKHFNVVITCFNKIKFIIIIVVIVVIIIIVVVIVIIIIIMNFVGFGC
jgi:hypothetical protein